MKTLPGSAVARSLGVLRIAFAWVLLLMAGSLCNSHAQVPPELAPELRDKNVMKFKLFYAQGVLEAIATENYPLLTTNAAQLSKLTREVSWRIRSAPEYERLTADFRRSIESLAKAAKNENADAATVAYFQMTVSCVTCHKYLKGRDVALAPESERLRPMDELFASIAISEKPNRTPFTR